MPRSEGDPVAIVLAAGRGERMGGPKALMTVRGEAWWRIQAARLRRAGVESIWVVSQVVREATAREADAPEHLVLGNPDQPMFESVVRGVEALRHAPPRGVFVLPIDVPAAGPEVWRALAARGPVSAPVFRGAAGHPVYLAWEWIERALLGAPAPGERRLDLLIAPLVERIEVDDPDVAVNLNAPADVDAWLGRDGATAP